jgi:hypothetical protein
MRDELLSDNDITLEEYNIIVPSSNQLQYSLGKKVQTIQFLKIKLDRLRLRLAGTMS